jgi:hypothetical protein
VRRLYLQDRKRKKVDSYGGGEALQRVLLRRKLE